MKVKEYSITTNLENVFVMAYSPKILRKDIKNRMTSSVLYILNGSYRYKYATQEFIAKSGDMVYLPKSSSYFYEVIDLKTEVIQVEFNLFEIFKECREDIKFSNVPLKIGGYGYLLSSSFENMKNSYYSDMFSTASWLYGVLAHIKNVNNSSSIRDDYTKILPAISYIESNFCSKIYVENLAKMCSLSSAQLRRLFLKCTGKSPIKYKNAVLVKTACNMLLSQGMNVTETADALGFNDIYMFSQLFKKEMGISPQKYKKMKSTDEVSNKTI